MRLLYRDATRLELTADQQDPFEPYAILSHTWFSAEEEVTFQDIEKGEYEGKRGYKKLDFLLTRAAQDGLRYAWADTCCIDKSKGPELDEALNRMFEWYARSAVCYAYLEDVPQVGFVQSRWFTRGWTLQELVAPRVIKFFDTDGSCLGDRASLTNTIRSATGIGQSLENASLTERFKWSLNRRTTKPEDRSYCLIGMLRVSMRSNYGEGGDIARRRLIRKVEKAHGERIAEEIRLLSTNGQLSSQAGETKLTIEMLKQVLSFDEMSERRQTIPDAHPQTCAWLLNHKSYTRWQKECPFLWIKGKPGAGKSTLMKFAERADYGPKISFYFNARGVTLEKSTVGMYRFLLFELLVSRPELSTCVLNHIESERYDIFRRLTSRILQDIFKQAIMHLSVPIHVYVDALDECSVDEVQEMVYFMDDLAQTCNKLAVCFASRHYPSITIINCIELQLDVESNHDNDIAKYVNARLNAGEDLKNQVIRKASGVFFWAMLVVRLLNSDISSGNVHNIKQRLERIPAGISALLQDLTKDPDERLILALQIISYASQPLSLEAFYFAMLSGLPDTSNTYAEPCTSMKIGEEAMRRFLYHCSRGLAEQAGVNTGGVQFIHESVRDFLLVEKGLPEVSNYAQSHDRLKQLCFRYAADPLNRHRSFFWYACLNLVYHAEQAASGVSQDDFIRSFESEELYRREDIFAAAQCNMPIGASYRVSLVHFLAAFDVPGLIHAAHRAGCDLSSPDSRRTPLVLAYLGRRIRTFEALIECGADLEACNEKGQTALTLVQSNERERLESLLNTAHDNIYGYYGYYGSMREQQEDNEFAALLINHGAIIQKRKLHDQRSPSMPIYTRGRGRGGRGRGRW